MTVDNLSPRILSPCLSLSLFLTFSLSLSPLEASHLSYLLQLDWNCIHGSEEETTSSTNPSIVIVTLENILHFFYQIAAVEFCWKKDNEKTQKIILEAR